jgi:hypothetical protein
MGQLFLQAFRLTHRGVSDNTSGVEDLQSTDSSLQSALSSMELSRAFQLAINTALAISVGLTTSSWSIFVSQAFQVAINTAVSDLQDRGCQSQVDR